MRGWLHELQQRSAAKISTLTFHRAEINTSIILHIIRDRADGKVDSNRSRHSTQYSIQVSSVDTFILVFPPKRSTTISKTWSGSPPCHSLDSFEHLSTGRVGLSRSGS